MNAKKRLDNVTIFRFVAAFYVFIFHANMRIYVNFDPLISFPIANGAVGMSFFFVLSGFILAYNYADGTGKGYFMKRIRRIYPAYIFCGVLTLPMLIQDSGNGLQSILTILTSIGLYITATQSWFYTTFAHWQFGGTWSISTEMFFYAMFPILIKLANNGYLKHMLIISFVSLSLIIPVSMVYNSEIILPVYYASPVYRLPEFVIGICAAKFMQNGVKVHLLAALASVAAMYYFLTFPIISYMQYNFAIVPCIAIILIYISQIGTSMIMKPFVWLGEISYSFYLMQVVGFMFFDRLKPEFIYNNGVYGWALLFIVFTAMAQVSYSLFEKRNVVLLIINSIYGRSYKKA